MKVLDVQGGRLIIANHKAHGTFAFNQMDYSYYALGEKIGQARKGGTPFMK